MSVILQSFLHNPLLRAYFLSDKHNRFLCPVSSITVGIDGKEISNVKDGESKPCLGCEMDRLFEEVSLVFPSISSFNYTIVDFFFLTFAFLVLCF